MRKHFANAGNSFKVIYNKTRALAIFNIKLELSEQWVGGHQFGPAVISLLANLVEFIIRLNCALVSIDCLLTTKWPNQLLHSSTSRMSFHLII